MNYVTVKKKYQVVIPASVRKQARIETGDLLEAKFEHGKVTFTPKSAIDRGIAESLQDFKKGRAYGPYDTAEEAIAALRAQAKKVRITRGSSSRR